MEARKSSAGHVPSLDRRHRQTTLHSYSSSPNRMKRSSSSPASSEVSDKKMKFSQSEVQILIEQEVQAALKEKETKLQDLIETIKKLDRDVDYECSMQKLQARVEAVARRAGEANAYLTKTHSQLPPLANGEITRADSEDETTDTRAPIGKKSMESMDKSGDFFKIMETTKKALQRMHTDNEALKAAMADLSEDRPPPVLTPYGSPEFKGLHVFIKKEPEEYHLTEKAEEKRRTEEAEEKRRTVEAEEKRRTVEAEEKRRATEEEEKRRATEEEEKRRMNEPQQKRRKKGPEEKCRTKEPPENKGKRNNVEESLRCEEQKVMVKDECLSPGQSNTPKHTEQETLFHPPLPPTTFPAILSMEAASYNIPQKPEVYLALVRNVGLSVHWKFEKEEPCAPPMDSYSVFMAVEKVKGSGVFRDWTSFGEVKALPLPMCAMISKYKPGRKVCVTVVGKDKFGRYGPYSNVVTKTIPE